MISLTVQNQCVLRGVTDPATVKAVTSALRVKNPDYEKAKRYGRGSWYIKEYLCLAQQEPDGSITFPREARQEVLRLLPEGVDVQDRRLKLPPIQFNAPAVEMRDYQETAINIIARVGTGVVEAPCGSGKTNIGHGVVQRIGQPTLWLTHKKDLLQQSLERCVKLLNVQPNEVGTITAGKVRLGEKITFATVQTLAGLPDDILNSLSDRFGLIVVDECHRAFETPTRVSQFEKCIKAFSAYYRVGISATVTRKDGLEKTMHWLLGKIVCRIPSETLVEGGYIIRPRVKRIPTKFEYEQAQKIDEDGNVAYRPLNMNEMLIEMTTDEVRNRLILDVVAHMAPMSHILILTARVEHAVDLHGWLSNMIPMYSPELVHGGIKMPERERIYSAVKRGECRVLVATYELAKEGLDMPVLDTLALATPVKNATMIEQCCGRVMRAFPGKTGAMVLDFVDQRVTALRRQWTARKKVYEKLRCEIQEVSRK